MYSSDVGNILVLGGLEDMLARAKQERQAKKILMEKIRRSPVDMVDIPLFTGFHACQVVSRISSINSRKLHFLSACIQLLFDQWIWLHNILQILNDITWYKKF